MSYEMQKRTIDFAAIGNWSDIFNATNGEAHKALMYMVLYSLSVYDHVEIRVNSHDNEMTAYYTITRPDVNRAGFLMVGVWHADEKKYSFHT